MYHWIISARRPMSFRASVYVQQPENMIFDRKYPSKTSNMKPPRCVDSPSISVFHQRPIRSDFIGHTQKYIFFSQFSSRTGPYLRSRLSCEARAVLPPAGIDGGVSTSIVRFRVARGIVERPESGSGLAENNFTRSEGSAVPAMKLPQNRPK